MQREREIAPVTARPQVRDWWEEQRGLQAALFALLLLMLSVFVHAQDVPVAVTPESFSCAADAGWIVDDGASFDPLPERPAELPVDARPIAFAADAQYGFSAVEFYPVTSAAADGAPATMTLFVHLAGQGAGRWYRYGVTPAAENFPAAGDGTQIPDPVAIGAPQPGLPLFHLGFYGRWRDGAQPAATGDVLILDLRGRDPRVVEHLNCATAPRQAEQTATSCRWDAARGDYACADSTVLDAGWTRRTASRRYWLFQDEDAYARGSGQPRSVAEFAARLARNRFRGDRALIEGAGDVRLLATWLPGGNGHRVFLFAARGAGDQMSARFFAASLDSDGEGSTAEIPVRDFDFSGLAPESARWSDDEVPGGDPIRYRTREVAVEGALRVLEVRVSEGAGQGTFWVAVDTSRRYLQADAVRLAAETLLPGRATVLAREQGALRTDLIPGSPFSAALQVEAGSDPAAPGVALADVPRRCVYLLVWEGMWTATKQLCAGDAQQQLSAVTSK
jgi:hypothetical protein